MRPTYATDGVLLEVLEVRGGRDNAARRLFWRITPYHVPAESTIGRLKSSCLVYMPKVSVLKPCNPVFKRVGNVNT